MSSEEEICVVCLEPLDEITTLRLPCGHMLHEACVARIRQHHDERLLAGGPPCPLCRTTMPVNPNDKARAAINAYIRLSGQIREGIENGTVPVDTHRQEQLASIALTQEAADLGDAEALCNLGVFYASGTGVERDPYKAFEMCLAAAEMGLSVAQSNVAHMFAQGSGTPQDYTRALHFWTLAANQNHTDAARTQCTISVSYIERASALQWTLRQRGNGLEEQRHLDTNKPKKSCSPHR